MNDSLKKLVYGSWLAVLILTGTQLPLEAVQPDVPEGTEEPRKVDSILIDQYDLEGVVISAGKQARNIQQVPASISSISSLKISRERIESLRDIGFRVPNLFLPDYGSRLTAPVYIRGVGSRINAPSVGLYVDQIAFFEKSGFDFDLLDIERIEVLRGPQGTLYGRNTMGGLIHIITRDPGSARDTRMLADLGSYGQQQVQVSHHQPLLAGKLNMSVSAGYNHRNGFHTNEYNDKPIDVLNSGGARLKFRLSTGPRSFVQWSIDANRSVEGGYPYGVVPDPEDGSAAPVLDYDHPSTYSRDMLTSHLWVERKGEAVKFTSVTGFQWFDDAQDIDQDFTAADLLYVTQDQVQNLLSQEIRFSNATEGRLEWIAGGYAFAQQLDRAVDVVYGEDGIAMFRLPGPMSKLKTYDMLNRGIAAFGQVSFNDLLPRLDLVMGLRYDREIGSLDYRYFLTLNGSETLNDDFGHSMTFSEFLPKMTLNYSWNERLFSYFSLAKGYKSGGFNSTIERPEDETFDPEYSWNYELGWKSSWYEKRLVLNLALFYVDWNDQQIYQTVPSGQGSMLKNAGKSFSRGLEIEASARPFNNLVSGFSFGYTDARFVEFSDSLKGSDFSGNYIPYVPRYTWAFNSTYRIPLRGQVLQDIAFSLNWQGTGRIFWDDENMLSQDPYSLMNLRVRFGLPLADLTLWADNVLQESYQAFRFTALGNTYAQPGRPFTFGMRVSVKF